MHKKLLVVALSVVTLFGLPGRVSAVTPIGEYLCDLGVGYYREGRFDDALHEFKKALMVDPESPTAKSYIGLIFAQEISPPPTGAPPLFSEPSREEVISQTLEKLKVSGEAQLSVGATSDDFIWKKANGDLNERSWRMLSDAAFDRRTDTFDPRVFDQVRVNVDLKQTEGVGFHSNITVDPWSFTGKSDKVTITGVDPSGDYTEVQLRYWSNTGYVINQVFPTLKNGDSFALPELKVVDGSTSATPIMSNFGNIFNLPAIKIYREFQPLRELWVDYAQEGYKFRFFPIAYQDQAFTSDDPLQLTNHHTWWEESHWLSRWLPGNYNFGVAARDFTRGKWDNSLSYFTRDSNNVRLTALRGFSFDWMPEDSTSLSTTFATPKDLWQDYGAVDNVINANRFKYRIADNLSAGALYTLRIGLDDNAARDVLNHVWGMDLGYSPWEGHKINMEIAASNTQRDLTSDTFKTRSRGNLYYLSLFGSSTGQAIMDLKYGYEEIKPEESSVFFFGKYRFYAARMDKGFDPSLSNFRNTRNDAFWSRHIHFRRPPEYFFSGLYFPNLRWDDVRPSALGDGIDIGRDAMGFRLETSSWDRGIDNLFDIRNVHQTDGQYVETVTRDEITYKATDKLTVKGLGIYQDLPDTEHWIDPFVFDANTGIPFNNQAIKGGDDPTLKTGSLGLEYAFTDRIALNGIWERTNDCTLAYGNFPRGILNSSSFTTFREFDEKFRREDPFLYSQALYPLAPYPYFNIFKSGLRLNPADKMEIYLDYTRNEFKSAGQIDDNINHVGLEFSYLPTEKVGMYLRYTYSRWNDINRMLDGYDKIYLSHHNFFTEFRYLPTADDELVMQYGESGRSPVSVINFDPFGGSLATLDTCHIVRFYYRRKF